MFPFNIIVAVEKNMGIGNEGKLPWRLPADMKFFKEQTTKTKDPAKRNAVIMGRKTWESIPDKFRPLPDRINIVLSKTPGLTLPKNVLQAASLDEALQLCAARPNEIEEAYIIGGAQVFKEAINHADCLKIYMTQILKDFSCDVFFPWPLSRFNYTSRSALMSDAGLSFYFLRYLKRG